MTPKEYLLKLNEIQDAETNLKIAIADDIRELTKKHGPILIAPHVVFTKDGDAAYVYQVSLNEDNTIMFGDFSIGRCNIDDHVEIYTRMVDSLNKS